MKLNGDDLRQRMAKLVQRLHRGEPVTSAWIRDTFDVSWATAKRDMAALRVYLPVSVTASKRGAAVRHELRWAA